MNASRLCLLANNIVANLIPRSCINAHTVVLPSLLLSTANTPDILPIGSCLPADDQLVEDIEGSEEDL